VALKIYPFIMCGGSGTRLWPMSTKSHPKQFHKIVSNLSMLQETVMRVRNPHNNVDVAAPSFICASAHRDLVLAQCAESGVKPHKIILEPMAKNTAAVAAAVALAMSDTEDKALAILLPADQYVKDIDTFWDNILKGCESALSGHIVTFGIKPTHPETGYGYIQSGSTRPDNSQDIVKFVEKPDLPTAQTYIQDEKFFWNAGIFLFSPKTMMSAFRAHAPDILSTVTQAFREAKVLDSQIFLDPIFFGQCRSESFDYAIMELAENISVIGPVDVGWNDIGSWRAVWEHENNLGTSSDNSGYCKDTNSCKVNSENVLIRTSGPFVATVGVSQIAVIATEKSVLVIDLDAAQDVKKVVEALKASEKVELY